MAVISRAIICIVAATCLGGCVKTVPSIMPKGQGAYDALASSRKVAATTAYPLQPGDKIRIEVFQEPDLTIEQILIDPSGDVSLPLLGAIHAGGQTPAFLEKKIETSLAARYLRNPKVSVGLLDAAPRTASIEGEVKQPGSYPVNSQTTLLSALALARSPTNIAKLDEVMVFRTVNGERLGGRFDVAKIRAGVADDPLILPNDVVVVGYSRILGGYRDILSAAPVFNAFTRY